MLTTISGHIIKNFSFISNYIAKGLGTHKNIPELFVDIRWERSKDLYFKSNKDESWDIDLNVRCNYHPEQTKNEKFLFNIREDDVMDLDIPYRIGEVAYTLDYKDVICNMHPLFGEINFKK